MRLVSKERARNFSKTIGNGVQALAYVAINFKIGKNYTTEGTEITEEKRFRG